MRARHGVRAREHDAVVVVERFFRRRSVGRRPAPLHAAPRSLRLLPLPLREPGVPARTFKIAHVRVRSTARSNEGDARSPTLQESARMRATPAVRRCRNQPKRGRRPQSKRGRRPQSDAAGISPNEGDARSPTLQKRGRRPQSNAETSRGGAAAVTWKFRGDELRRRRRGDSVETGRGGAAAATWIFREETSRGGAAAATWRFRVETSRSDAAAATWRFRVETSRSDAATARIGPDGLRDFDAGVGARRGAPRRGPGV